MRIRKRSVVRYSEIALAALVLGACNGSLGPADSGEWTPVSPGGTGSPNPTAMNTSTGSPSGAGTQMPSAGATVGSGPTNTPVGPVACAEADVTVSKRLVRLTFNQLDRSLRSLLGNELADAVNTKLELPSAYERTFPPLNSPREGSVIIDAQWQTGDALAQAAGQHVFDKFSEVTGCGGTPTADCVNAYLTGFVEKAFRRPLSSEELTAFLAVPSGVIAAGGTPQDAAQYGVYAALSAPQFLYRPEFGDDANAPGKLTPYETASMLSYFITDGPPDSPLLEAAAGGQLATAEQIEQQVTRLLQTPDARENLQSAMFSYFGISKLDTIVIDPAVAPQFTEGLRSSMIHETELFINDTVWNGKVSDLLLSRSSTINQGLADLYGVAFPPAGAQLDADGFARVTLPDGRSGILTQPGYLTTRSSPDKPSVVRRGLLVNASLLCAENPEFPQDQAESIAAINANLTALSEREKADFRVATTACAECHKVFDAYGLGLDNFDVIGAYRSVDPEGRPIDPTVTLPPLAGGVTVTSPAEMAQKLVESGAFSNCMAKNLLSYALSEGNNLKAESCATRQVSEAFAKSDGSFSSLIKEVAKSSILTSRVVAEVQ